MEMEPVNQSKPDRPYLACSGCCGSHMPSGWSAWLCKVWSAQGHKQNESLWLTKGSSPLEGCFYLSARSRCIFSWHERQRLIRLDSSFDPSSARETEMAGWAGCGIVCFWENGWDILLAAYRRTDLLPVAGVLSRPRQIRLEIRTAGTKIQTKITWSLTDQVNGILAWDLDHKPIEQRRAGRDDGFPPAHRIISRKNTWTSSCKRRVPVKMPFFSFEHFS